MTAESAWFVYRACFIHIQFLFHIVSVEFTKEITCVYAFISRLEAIFLLLNMEMFKRWDVFESFSWTDMRFC